MSLSSSEHYKTKSCVENMRQLDVRLLQRVGLLHNGKDYGWSWNRDGRNVANIHLTVQTDQVLVQYSHCQQDATWLETAYEVPLERTPCHLGGERVWWRCPGPGCGRRVALLYAGTRIACRHCHDLAYRCQRESAEYRAARQANKIRRKLGWKVGILNFPGEKPKGMHWKTFARMQAIHNKHSQTALACMTKSLGLFQGQLERIQR